MSGETVVQARGIRKVFKAGAEELEILKHVDLEVAAGEVLAITGVSGVGKSTLLHILGTLDRPTAGELAIHAVDVLHLQEADLATFRNKHIGFGALLPGLGRQSGLKRFGVILAHSYAVSYTHLTLPTICSV